MPEWNYPNSNTQRAINCGNPGIHTVFVRVKEGIGDALLPADLITEIKSALKNVMSVTNSESDPIDISSYFNVSLKGIKIGISYWKLQYHHDIKLTCS
jgi:hypothetical protein